MKKESAGTVLAVLAAVVSGFSIPMNKIFIVSLDPVVFTAVRSIVIGVAFLALACWLNRSQKRKKFISVGWKYLAAIALVGGAAAFLLYFTGLKLTTAGHAAFLHKTLPLYVAVLAFVFLKEKISRRYAYAMVLMFLGTVAIYFTQISPAELWANPQLGDLLVIAATILWAVENVIARKAMKNGEHNFIVSFSRMFFGGLVLFGAMMLMGKSGALLSLTNQQMAGIGISTVLLFAYVLFFYWSLRFINASKAAVMLLLAPVVSLAVGVAFLNEPAPLLQLAGSAVILAGAYLVSGMRSEERGI